MFRLTATQQTAVAIAVVDRKGNPASVDGIPSWDSSDPSVATVTPAADGLSAVVSAVGLVGTAQINVSADADLGAGVVPLTGTLDIEVIAGMAAQLQLTAAPAEEQAAV